MQFVQAPTSANTIQSTDLYENDSVPIEKIEPTNEPSSARPRLRRLGAGHTRERSDPEDERLDRHVDDRREQHEADQAGLAEGEDERVVRRQVVVLGELSRSDAEQRLF
jgi:hypothetical protein